MTSCWDAPPLFLPADKSDSFNALVEETLGDDCNYDTVMNIHEKLNELIESQKDEPEPVSPYQI